MSGSSGLASNPSVLKRLNARFPDATALALAVRSGATTAAEVLAAARARAESPAGARTNAFTSTDWDNAAAVAASLDNRRNRGEELGPLAGVPLSVKDVIAVAGLPVSAASRAFAGTLATVTAPAVERLIDAGAVLVGKTNCPEFAFGVTCDSPLQGRTANPRFPHATPGGSSGGEAAALALGISGLGVGTDFGGSLRWPAQCVGIAALRPGLGAIPGAGQVPGVGGNIGDGALMPIPSDGMQGQFQTVGPMARSVRDLRTAYLVMSGASALAGLPDDGAFRIAWTSGTALGPVRNEVRFLMRRLAATLTSQGHSVSHQPEILDNTLSAYNRLRAVDPMTDHATAIRGREDLVTAANLQTINASFQATAADVESAWRDARTARTVAVRGIEAVDFLIVPVAGGPAADVEGMLDVDGRQLAGWEMMGHCRAVTLTGCPSVSLPLGISREGLPLSVQVITGRGQELKALEFASRLESLELN